MCEPTTIMAGMSLAMGAVSAVGQMQNASAQADAMRVQGENQQNIANYNAQVQENNAIIADRNSDIAEEQATDAIRRGANEAGDVRDRIRKIQSTGRAIQGSTGLLLEGGNFSDVLDQNEAFGEMEALTSVNNAEREAYGFKVEAHNFDVDASNLRSQAVLTRAGGQASFDAASSSASNIKQAAAYSATDSLVSGAINAGKLKNFGVK